MRPYLFLTAIAIFFGLAGFFGLGASVVGFILWGLAVLFGIFAVIAFFIRKKAKESAAAHPVPH
jgi:uncharacterized membrane protein